MPTWYRRMQSRIGKRRLRAVHWYGSRGLYRQVRRIIRYAVDGDVIDARDWMQANGFVYVNGDLRGFTDPLQHQSDAAVTGQEALWFDYVADTGDDWYATHDIAYVLHGPLWIGPALKPTPGVEVSTAGEGTPALPRGEFLLFGGDTAYHVASGHTIRERVEGPYDEAYTQRFGPADAPHPRPLLGIPGNHDWYDSLDGFCRLFREPALKVPSGKRPSSGAEGPISLKGYVAIQSGSYFAIRLPWQWDLWAVDIQKGHLDRRQIDFFRTSVRRPPASPSSANADESTSTAGGSKLILVSATPIWEAGFHDVEIEAELDKIVDGGGRHPPLRLDLAGDTHNYQYYDLREQENTSSGGRLSVVAGGGGAFLHPTHHMIGPQKPTARYPSEDMSSCLSRRLLNPWHVYQAGMVPLLIVILQLALLWRMTIPEVGPVLIGVSGLAGLYATWVGVEFPVYQRFSAVSLGIFVYALVWSYWAVDNTIPERILASILAASFVMISFAGIRQWRPVVAVTFASVALGFLSYALTAWLFSGHEVLRLTWDQFGQLFSPPWLPVVVISGILWVALASFGVLANGYLGWTMRPQLGTGPWFVGNANAVGLTVAFASVETLLPYIGALLAGLLPIAHAWVIVLVWTVITVGISPIIFGSYLFVALNVLGTHRNEAFSALRYPGYKHFIRFKLERHQLTGYVIGFDQPSTPHRPMSQARIIHEFTLK